jgi:hypothetical protein
MTGTAEALINLISETAEALTTIMRIGTAEVLTTMTAPTALTAPTAPTAPTASAA